MQGLGHDQTWPAGNRLSIPIELQRCSYFQHRASQSWTNVGAREVSGVVLEGEHVGANFDIGQSAHVNTILIGSDPTLVRARKSRFNISMDWFK